MDPITAMMGISAAMKIAGGVTSYFGSSEANSSQRTQVALEQQAEGVRHEQATTDFRRKNLEVLRNAQRARALSTNNSATQGALFGSGYAGGQAQIGGYESTNLLALSQNMQFGNQMFDINAQISHQKIEQLKGQNLMSLGNAISGAGSAVGSVAGQFQQLTGRVGGGTGGDSMGGMSGGFDS